MLVTAAPGRLGSWPAAITDGMPHAVRRKPSHSVSDCASQSGEVGEDPRVGHQVPAFVQALAVRDGPER